jgi:hypothetical protein
VGQDGGGRSSDDGGGSSGGVERYMNESDETVACKRIRR